jgi:hypothetical protein
MMDRPERRAGEATLLSYTHYFQSIVIAAWSSGTGGAGVLGNTPVEKAKIHPKLEVPRLTCSGGESNPDLHGGRRAIWKRAIRTAC